MALFEFLSWSIGSAVVRVVLRFWLDDDEIAKDSALDLEAALSSRIPGALERRRTRRQLESVADEVALRLERYFSAEFYGGLEENERIAAGRAVARTLEEGLDRGLIFAVDLEPSQLFIALSQRVPDGAGRELLSEAATALYHFALREACNYIIEIGVTLPTFDAESTKALLQRDTEIIDLVRKVLNNLPAPAENGGFHQDEDGRFDTDYRRYIARKLDRLSIFGLNVGEASQRYALSVAYITLSATNMRREVPPGGGSSHGGVERTLAEKEPGKSTDSADPEYVRIDEVLSASSRVLVRGEAGSGKTTLLQWLAVSCAKRSFTGELSQLNEATPFFLQLRRFVDRELPHPSEFLDQAATPLAGTLPPGWVEQKLDSGDAVVLIDGVDELPEAMRGTAREWLRDLCDAYPSARYVVTSRPPAVSDDWLGNEDFSVSELQPMDLSDIDEFIAHWHAAIRGSVIDEGDLAELSQLEEDLRSSVRATRPIRALATSPLLCAMLCALNRDRRAQLPRDRVELYRIALETLLERRDIERRIKDAASIDLTRRQREILLEDLAYWLQLNGHTDGPVDLVEQRFAMKLTAMAAVNTDAQAVLKHLLLRSGVIREPVEGRVDFIHRTFQEFLAAREALQQEHIGVLRDNAHRDEWSEVVVLAAGAGSLRQRTELISDLLARGRSEDRHRHRLHLLAVACLETSPELPAELRAELQACLTELVPPRNMSEARSLSSAGDLAVPLLAEHVQANVPIARPSIRALCLIGTQDALNVVARCGRDTRVTIFREVLRGWTNFDREEFARQVLLDSPLAGGTLEVTSASVVPYLQSLKHLKELAGDFSGGSVDLAGIAAYPQLKRLRIWNNRRLAELDPLRDHPGLRQLRLSGCPRLDDIQAVGTLTELRVLEIADCPVRDLSPLYGTTRLESLMLVRTAAEDITPVSGMRSLKRIHMSHVPMTNLSWLPPDAPLAEVRITSTDLRNVEALADHPAMRVLDIYGCEVDDMEVVGGLEMLRYCRIAGNPVRDLSPLGGCRSLEVLDLAYTKIKTFTGIEGLPVVRVVYAHSCELLANLSALAELSSLTRLVLIGCQAVSDIGPVSRLPTLRQLDLEGCPGVKSLEPLRGTPALTWIDVSWCDNSLDLGPLRDIPTLKVVRAFGMRSAVDRAELRGEGVRVYTTGPPTAHAPRTVTLVNESPLGDEAVNESLLGDGD